MDKIKWYKNGKLYNSDDKVTSQSSQDDGELFFEIGERVRLIKQTYYFNTRYNHNDWIIILPSIKSTVTDVSYVTDYHGYTGQIIKIDGHWPWFQSDGFIKI